MYKPAWRWESRLYPCCVPVSVLTAWPLVAQSRGTVSKYQNSIWIGISVSLLMCKSFRNQDTACKGFLLCWNSFLKYSFAVLNILCKCISFSLHNVLLGACRWDVQGKRSHRLDTATMKGLFATPWTAAFQAPLSMGMLQARILEWDARDRTQVSLVASRFFTIWTTRESWWRDTRGQFWFRCHCP